MSEHEKSIRLKLKKNFKHFAEKCLKIVTKNSGESGSAIVPFKLNKSQEHILSRLEEQKKNTGKVRAIILKGRQSGGSTFVAGRFFHMATQNFGILVFILTHHTDATNNLYKMAKRFYEYLPDIVKPTINKSNSRELIFGDLSSGYRVGTAGNKNVGRAETIHLFHGSEVAHWKNTGDLVAGIFNSVPNAPNTEIILESTANGVGNFFHKMWQDAEAGISEYIPIFTPWFWSYEYREKCPYDMKITDEEAEFKNIYKVDNDQIFWRRKKIIEFSANGMDGAKKFKQEYPSCAQEAFIASNENALIPSDAVASARSNENAEIDTLSPLIIGCDPAHMGEDRTAIIRRRGRVAYGLETYCKKDAMEVVGILNKIILEEAPSKMFIDYGLIGGAIVDRLKELGHSDIVQSVNFGSTSLEPKKYVNKKAEIWGQCRDWIMSGEVKIPDSDELHADLCSVSIKEDSLSRLIIEDKKSLKEKGIRSPDAAEALCLTFAMPAHSYYHNKKSNIASKILEENMRLQNLRRASNVASRI